MIVVFPTPGPPVMMENLDFSERTRAVEARARLPPRERLVRVDRTERTRRGEYAADVLRGLPLAPVEGAQVDAARGGIGVADDAARRKLLLQRRAEHLRRDLRKLVRVQEQVVLVRPAVSAVLRLRLQRVGDGRAGAQRGVLRESDRERDLVRRREAYPPDVAAELVRVALDYRDGVGSVPADDLRHLRDGDAVGLSEDHVLAHRLVRAPALADLGDLRLAELRHLHEAGGLAGEDVERVLAERIDDALGEHLADALDESGREVALDADD